MDNRISNIKYQILNLTPSVIASPSLLTLSLRGAKRRSNLKRVFVSLGTGSLNFIRDISQWPPLRGETSFVLFVFSFLWFANFVFSETLWVQSNWRDFINGEVDPSMYVSRRAQLEPDSGCVEFFARFDVDNNGYYDLGCSDDSGSAGFVRLYLGSVNGYFPDSVLTYSSTAAGNVDLADLNLDGYAELIQSGWTQRALTIYWGTPSGPSPTDTTQLSYTGFSEAVAVYDLDEDTYLDILIGSSAGYVYIFWGSDSGYYQTNYTRIMVNYSAGHNLEIADFDKDGWGDIAVSLWTYNQNPIIYWGPNRQPRTIVWLPFFYNNGHGISVGDINRDGWLDIVYQGYDTVTTSYIYFGSAQGFMVTNRTIIRPGLCYGGSALIDWNYDSWLDIVFFRGNWYNGGGPWKPVVYFNTRTPPYFDDGQKIELGNLGFNASGGFSADFNYDGNLDIFVNNMRRQDSSYILWGPNYTDRNGLPVNYDHHGIWREPGNIYDRTFSAFYFSSIYDAGPDSIIRSGLVNWVSYQPPESDVKISFRAGNTPTPDTSWTKFYFVIGNGGPIPDSATGYRYLQYKATFEYGRPCFLPHLEKIIITVRPGVSTDVGVERILAPTGSVDSGSTIIPVARVINNGTSQETFPVTMKIGTSYSQVRNKSLRTGESDTVNFPAWTATDLGTHIVRCSTGLTADLNRLNDTLSTMVNVRSGLDVGVVAIISPVGILDSGSITTPQARITNYGTSPVSTPVIFKIGSSYQAVRTKNLLGGQTDTVNFPPWIAEPLGNFPVKCSTALFGDRNPLNDFLIDSVSVIQRVDVGVVQIISPTGNVNYGTTIIPQAQVTNYGSSVITTPVIMRIGSNYSEIRNKTLLPGILDTVNFPSWTALSPGTNIVKCSTALSNDRNPSNDAQIDSVFVTVRIDAGVISIISPQGVIDSGTTVQPIALIGNYGINSQVIPVRFSIGTYYTDVRTKTINAGSSDTIVFSSFRANFRDINPIRCSTALPNDQNPANDLKTDSFLVRVSDVGVVEIIEPKGIIPEGRFTPKALIRNYGTGPESFSVLAKISNNLYLDTVTIQGLIPDTNLEITFTSGQGVVGNYLVSCSTLLNSDMNRSNDKKIESLRIVIRNIAIEPDSSASIYPGMSITYRLTVTNLSSLLDTIDLIPYRTKWDIDLLNSQGQVLRDNNNNGLKDLGEFLPNQSKELRVRITAPNQALANIIDTCLINARSGADTTIQDNANLFTRILSIANISLEPNQEGTTPPGIPIEYEIIVKNFGNSNDVIDLLLQDPKANWNYALLDFYGNPLPDRNFNGREDIGPLLPFSGEGRIRVRVIPPTNGQAGEKDTVKVIGISSNNPLVQDNVQLITEITGLLTLIQVEPDQEDILTPGETKTYYFWVETEGNIPDVVNLTVNSSSQEWKGELFDGLGRILLLDTDGDNNVDLGGVAPMVRRDFTLIVKAPKNPNLIGGIDSIGANRFVITGFPSHYQLKDSAILRLRVIPNLDIHNYENPFRDRTMFIFSLPYEGTVNLTIYNRLGERHRSIITNRYFARGVHQVPWDGKNDFGKRLAPGTYIYLFEYQNKEKTEKIIKKAVITN